MVNIRKCLHMSSTSGYFHFFKSMSSLLYYGKHIFFGIRTVKSWKLDDGQLL